MSVTYSGADARLQYLFSALEDKVAYTPALTTGTLSGTLTIDGVDYQIYCSSGGGGGGSSALTDLDDVDITTPTDGQVLTYNATSQQWENADASGGGGSIYPFSVVDGMICVTFEEEE